MKLLVDGHVHFHACFTWKRFLDAAAANFAHARRRMGVVDDSLGCLMLTESVGVNCYRALIEKPATVRSLGWDLEHGGDRCSLVLTRGGRETLVIVAGRQIVTAERLEVLALGCTDDFPEHRPVRDVLRAVVERGALAVLPWGFGKWWGGRGRLIAELIDRPETPFCLGDIGGRSGVGPRPPLLGRAERRGLRVLAGTDPLAIPSQVTRAGSYGFLLDSWDAAATRQPMTAIRARIQALHRSPVAFGELSSLAGMIRSQLGIRMAAAQSRPAVGPNVEIAERADK